MTKKVFRIILAVVAVIIIICVAAVNFIPRSEQAGGYDIPRLSHKNIVDAIGLFTGRLGLASQPAGSMEDTIQVGDSFGYDKKAYAKKLPERFDVIMFKSPDDESVYFAKRIIGLPGETIEIIDGQVYINNEPLEEDFIKGEWEENFEAYEIGENSYFTMGDNRNVSGDSRIWINKTVPFENIKGKVILLY